MEILRAYRFRIRPTGHQATLFGQYCGVARFSWNWGVKACRQEYEAAVEAAKEADDYTEETKRDGTTYKKWNTKGRMPISNPGTVPDGTPKSFGGRLYAAFLLEHQLEQASKRKAKRDPSSHPHPWLLPIYSHVYSYALANVVKAYGAFWKGLKAGRGTGRPLLKSKNPVGKIARRKWGVRQDRHPSFGFQVQPGRQIVQAQPTCPKCQATSHKLAILVCPACGEPKPVYVVLPPMMGLGPLKVWDDLSKMRGRPVMATVRQEADKWFISISCKIQIDAPKPEGAVIGADLGVNSIVTLWSQEPLDVDRLERRLTGLTDEQEELLADDASAGVRDARIADLGRLADRTPAELDELKLLDSKRRHREVVRRCKAVVQDSIIVTTEDEGTLYELRPPLPLHRKQKRLARMQRALKRKEKGSKRKTRAELQITRLHETIRCQRVDYLHKLSRWLTEEGRTVVMEGFDVSRLVQHAVPKNMKGKRKRDRRRKILDIAWGDLRFRTEYKGVEHGADFVMCDTFKATDRPCYLCGTLNEIPPTTSAYHCEGCGNQTTRQRNTARLLESFGRGNSPESTPGHGETDDVDPTALPPSEAGEHPAGLKRNGSLPSPGGNGAAGGSAPKKARKKGGRKRRKPRAPGTGANTSQTPSMEALGAPSKGTSST